MGALDRVRQWVRDQYEAEIRDLRAWYDDATHHGCFCGAGTRCTEAVDALDTCCQQHDAGYATAGISADVMWEVPDGWVKAIHADAALVQCAQGAATNDAGYQQQLIWLFSARVRIAQTMEAWIQRAQEVEDGLGRLRDWLLSANANEVQQGVQAYTAQLTELGASHDEVAMLVQEHAPASGDGTQIA